MVTHNRSIILDRMLNILIYRSSFYVIISKELQPFKKSPVLPTLYVLNNQKICSPSGRHDMQPSMQLHSSFGISQPQNLTIWLLKLVTVVQD